MKSRQNQANKNPAAISWRKDMNSPVALEIKMQTENLIYFSFAVFWVPFTS